MWRISQYAHSASSAYAMSLLAPAYEAPSLCTLPCHLLQRVLSWLDPQALCALAQTCSALLAACSDPQLWPPATWSPVTAALAGALSEATRLPAPLLARQLSLNTHSCFQATLSLCGLRAVLELTDAGATAQRRACPPQPPAKPSVSPADRWLLGLVASPVAALAAEGAAAGRAPCQQDDLVAFLAASTSRARGVLCSRAERTAVRLQLSAQFTVVTTLRAAASYEEGTNDQCMLCRPDAVERLASCLLPGAGSGVVGRWSSGLHTARMHALAEHTLQKPRRLRASLEHFGGALSPDLLDFRAVAQSVCEADAALALLIDAVSCEAPRREDVFVLGGQAVPAASTCAGLSVSRAALLLAAAGALERGICALLKGRAVIAH